MNAQRYFLIVLIVVTCATMSLRGDVTIKSTSSMEGIAGLMNSEGTEVKMLSGMKAKTESTHKSTSKTMKFLGGGKPKDEAEVIRIDKEVFWSLNIKDKEYTERTFAEVAEAYKKALDKAAAEKSKAPSKKSDKNSKKSSMDTVEIKTEYKVTHTGKKQKIAGYQTEETILTGIVKGKNSQSEDTASMTLTMDLWLAQDVPGRDESLEFYRALATKLGYGSAAKEGLGSSLMAMGVDPEELEKQASQIKGFPMMTILTITAAGDTTKQHSGKAQDKNQKEETSSSDNSSKPNPLSSLFGKKQDKNKDAKDKKDSGSESSADSGPVALLKYTETVTEIGRTSIPASEFEVPAGFKKK